MKKVIFGLLIGLFAIGTITSCNKKNYTCYDTVYDSLGNGVPSTNGKVKKYFKDNTERVQYQTATGKSCIENY